IECGTWSDSVSVRYSGPLLNLITRARKHGLFMCNIDGVLYADPSPTENILGEIVPVTNFEPASKVAEEDSVHDAFFVEELGDPRLLITTTGVENASTFLKLSGRYGWTITEAKEAQIRFGSGQSEQSFYVDRYTDEVRQLKHERDNERTD
ncbi:hypothetical protein, partial [Haloferax profundi]